MRQSPTDKRQQARHYYNKPIKLTFSVEITELIDKYRGNLEPRDFVDLCIRDYCKQFERGNV